MLLSSVEFAFVIFFSVSQYNLAARVAVEIIIIIVIALPLAVILKKKKKASPSH